MAKTDVLNWKKERIGEIDLDPDVFEREFSSNILHTVVRWQLACRRQGTHQAKTRGMVRGGGKKPYRQKGTGAARRGSTRSPLICGGGVIFGPSPRDYSYQLPKKMRKVGLMTALSHLNREGRLFVIDELKSEGKTKALAKQLNDFGLSKAVLVDNESNDLFKRASQNLSNFRYYVTNGLNVYDLLKFDHLIITKDSVESLQTKLKAGM